MAERFIGADERGNLLYRDDVTGAVRTEYPVGTGGIFERGPAPLPNVPGFLQREANQGYRTQDSAQRGANIFDNLFPGYTDNSQIGVTQERLGRVSDYTAFPLMESNYEKALPYVQTSNPREPNYVRPIDNYLGLNFGGEGFLGMSGPRGFSEVNVTSDVPRYFGDVSAVNFPGRQTGVAPETDAQLKLLNTGRFGKQFMYQDYTAAGTRDTYLLPEEVASKLGINATGIQNTSELVTLIDKTLKEQNNKNFSKKDFDMGGTGVVTGAGIDVNEVGNLFKENAEEVAKDRTDIEDALSRQGTTLFDKVKNIFDDPYDDYVDAEGRTIKGDFVKREDEALLKKNNLFDEEQAADAGPAFTKDQAYELLGMYLTMGSLMTDEPPKTTVKMGSYSVSPGLRLDVPNLYDKRKRG